MNTEDNISNFFLNENLSVDINVFIINILTTVILCFLVRQVYLRFSESLSNKDYFSKNFIVLGVTTCIIISIVKSSLALSLGLVGALSIVRFRAAIKEPEELIYLFLVISIGLGAGANQTKIILVGTLVTLLVIVVFYFVRTKKYENIKSEVFQLSVSNSKKFSDDIFNNIIKTLNANCKEVEFISLSSSNTEYNLNFEIILLSAGKIAILNKLLVKISNNSKIILSKKDNLSL